MTLDPRDGAEWRALSLSRPWPWVILHMGKRIENRKQRWTYRGRVLLHGALSSDYQGAWDHVVERSGEIGPIGGVAPEALFRSQLPGVFDQYAGVVFATARVVDCVGPREYLTGVSGVAYPGRSPALRAECLKWHMRDRYGLVLEDVRPTLLVPCRGALGLWNPPESVLASALEV